MKKKLLWMIPLAIVIGIGFAMLDWPIWMGIALFVFIAILEIPIMLYTLYASQNLARITKYIVQNRKNPIFQYMYLLPEGTEASLIEAIDTILRKYKQPNIQAIYGANRAILLEDFDEARRLVYPVLQSELGQYTMALIAAMQGNGEEMQQYKVEKEWMKAGLEANLAFAQGDTATFDRTSQQAIDSAKGVQYYGNIYVFKRMRDSKSKSVAL